MMESAVEQDTKLVLVSREPLLYLKFHKPNKQNVYEYNNNNKFNFSQSQNNCWHALIDVRIPKHQNIST